MANSDNVLRGGLTPKHMDVPELLATLVFEAHTPEILRPVESAPGELSYHTPAREFELGMLGAAAGQPYASNPGRGVEILLGLEGAPVLKAGEQEFVLGRGRSVFVPAAIPSYVIEGDGRVCRARVPA
jgi:mannose-6-phosphate isomerase